MDCVHSEIGIFLSLRGNATIHCGIRRPYLSLTWQESVGAQPIIPTKCWKRAFRCTKPVSNHFSKGNVECMKNCFLPLLLLLPANLCNFSMSDSVWPDVELKSSPIFFKKLPNSRHNSLFFKVMFFKTVLKDTKSFGKPSIFKKSQIWPHFEGREFSNGFSYGWIMFTQ